MKDSEIIKVLECCKGYLTDDCIECPYVEKYPQCATNLREAALGLINRQKAEIERLEKEIKGINRIEKENELQALEENKENAKMFLQAIKKAKSEAMKEFAERLKEYAIANTKVMTEQAE